MFSVTIKRKALRKLARLGEKRRKTIKEIVSILKREQIPFRKTDVCKLKGYDSVYRIRVGDLRIVYEVFWAQRAIVIHYVGSREKAYRK